MTAYKNIIQSFSTFSKSFIALFLLGLMYSCFDIELVDRAQLTIVTQWEKLDADVTVPSSYTVEIGQEKLKFSGASNPLPDLLPGDYKVVVYNDASHLSVNNNIATVTQSNGLVNSMPGWFFSAVTNVTYNDNVVDTIIVPMKQQIRELRIRLHAEGGSKENIKEIQTKLTGVAGSWDLLTNTATGNAREIALPFVKQADGTWLAVVRLLGIVGNRQTIVGEIIFDNAVPKDLHIDTDISSSLIDFNVNKYLPLAFTGNIETPTQAGFTGSITDWKQISQNGIAW